LPERSRFGLRAGLLAALVIAACQTAHPVALPEAPPPPAVVSPLVLPNLLLPARQLAPELAVPAALDPAAIEREPAADLRADAAWIDALLQRRAPTLGNRARAAVAREVASSADAHGVDPLVVLSVIAHESRFDPRAHGQRSALGLMQIRPFVARDVARRHGIPWAGDSTLLDPARNVAIGTAYLGEILRQFGDLELALAGYNLGPARLQRMLARGDAPEGEYLGRILTHYADLAGLAAALESGPHACAEVNC
jgi:soluble lytic murein transglycosylase-like protein